MESLIDAVIWLDEQLAECMLSRYADFAQCRQRLMQQS
jgi:hypothetical protein